MTSQKKQEGCCEKCKGYYVEPRHEYFPLCNNKGCPCHTAPVGGEGETQKGWRERLREVPVAGAVVTIHYIHNIEDFIEAELAAQETAFKERVIEALYEEKAKLNGYVIPAENLALMRGIDLALTRIERLSQ